MPMDPAIAGALIGIAGTASLATLGAAARQFVGESKKGEPGTQVVGVTHSELRAVMAEFQITLRDELLDPMRKDIAEVHGCIDGAREDMRQIREDVRHDVGNKLMPITSAVEALGRDLAESVRHTERFRLDLDKRMRALEDDDYRRMRAAASGGGR